MQNQCVVFVADPIQYKLDLIDSVTAVNSDYLGFSVAIILGGGILLSVLMYFRFFSPLTKKLMKQEREISVVSTKVEEERRSNRGRLQSLTQKQNETLSDFKTSINKLITESLEKQGRYEQLLETLEKKMTKQSKKLDDLIEETDRKIDEVDIYTEWLEHYVWETKDIPINVFISLVSCLDKCILRQNLVIANLCLKKLKSLIPKLTEKEDRRAYANYSKELKSTIETIDTDLAAGKLKELNIEDLNEVKKVLTERADK